MFEAVKSLGHNAENIGEDLILVSKFVAKKISKRMKSVKAEDSKDVKTNKALPPQSKTATQLTTFRKATLPAKPTHTVP